MLENLPKEGAYRLMPPSAIAEAAWSAYQDSDPIHFYVPPRLPTDKLQGFWTYAAREEIKSFC